MSAIISVNPVNKQSLHLVTKPEPKATTTSRVTSKAETNPLIVVGVACIVAFHLAAAMVGTVAAWVYLLH